MSTLRVGFLLKLNTRDKWQAIHLLKAKQYSLMESPKRFIDPEAGFSRLHITMEDEYADGFTLTILFLYCKYKPCAPTKGHHTWHKT